MYVHDLQQENPIIQLRNINRKKTEIIDKNAPKKFRKPQEYLEK